MYTSILIPVAADNSPLLDTALSVAAALKAPEGRVELLHVIETIPGFVMAYVPEDLRQNRLAESRKMLEGIAARAPMPVEIVLEQGHGALTIAEHAARAGTDLIVMVSHKPELQDIFFGSTAGEVVRHVDCAVHVLR